LLSIEKHEPIALRFLLQEQYEAAAELAIEPKPDVVTREFVLFCGMRGAISSIGPRQWNVWKKASNLGDM
jgi:hypothetical protein